MDTVNNSNKICYVLISIAVDNVVGIVSTIATRHGSHANLRSGQGGWYIYNNNKI